ncbi:DUF4266 domain-containing protein [Kaarinaea lacus]
MKSVSQAFLLFIASLVLMACSLQTVEPWDRDVLAQKKMQLISDKLENYADEHIYFSKEASTGGQGVGGGGCGCN